MWMVVGGPLIVVIASFVTLYLAIRTPDPVYTHDGPDAMQARNHAATGGVAPKKPAASAAASK
jgi:hypothetical protein